MAPSFNPDSAEISEIILPDLATASEVIAPDGSTVFSVIPDSVVSQYQFEDDGDTTTAIDSAGSNDATLNGGPTYDASAHCGSAALSTDGTDDEAVSNSTVDLASLGSTVGASVAGFFNPDNTNDGVFAQWSVDNDNYLRIAANGGNVEVAYQVDGGNFYSVTGPSIDTSQYTHVVCAVDDSSLDLIIDGSQSGSSSVSDSPSNLGDGDLRVGFGPALGAYYEGLSDNVSFSDEKLSESQAQELINQC
jgi:hypothetical protein